MARRSNQGAAGQVRLPGDQGAAPDVVGHQGVYEAEHPGENGRVLRLLALAAVVAGLVILTAAACVLSYSSVHVFALQAGVADGLARIYPAICDAMLVIAGCSVLALRGAGLFSKIYAWLCFILLLAVVAASGVIHEAGLHLPKRTTEIIAAVFPWALVLVAFGLLLALLRYARRRRHNNQAQRGHQVPDVPAVPAATAVTAPAQQLKTESASDEADGAQSADDQTAELPPPPLPGQPTVPQRAAAPPAEMQLRASTQRRPSAPQPPPAADLATRNRQLPSPGAIRNRARATRKRRPSERRAACPRARRASPQPHARTRPGRAWSRSRVHRRYRAARQPEPGSGRARQRHRHRGQASRDSRRRRACRRRRRRHQRREPRRRHRPERRERYRPERREQGRAERREQGRAERRKQGRAERCRRNRAER